MGPPRSLGPLAPSRPRLEIVDMTATAIGGISPFFIVHDVARSLSFYRDLLGFDVTFSGFGDDLFFGIVQRGSAMIMFKSVGVDPVPNHRRDPSARWDAYLYVPDPDTLAAEFAGRDVRFSKPLEDTSDGLRGFELADPDGHVLFFGRPLPKPDESTVDSGSDIIERAVPVLPGDDLGVAKEFYVGRLGFTVEWEDTADGTTGIMGIARGSIELTIDCPMSGHGRQVSASLRVNSADAYYEEWRSKIDIPRPPRDEVWDARTFGFTDPAGNTLFVIGPPSRSGE